MYDTDDSDSDAPEPRLRSTGIRDLTPAEREEIRAIVCRRGRICRVVLLLLPAVLLGGFLGAVEMHSMPPPWTGASTHFMVLTIALFAFGLLVTRDQMLETREFRADARRGQVEHLVPETDEPENPIELAASPGARPERLWELEVLPASGRAWTVNRRPAYWRRRDQRA
jgi:hypothetical protein